MKLLGLLGVLGFIFVTRAARIWSPETYPNPLKDVESCGRRGVSSWVCDPDGVVSYESANVVEGIIKKIYAGQPPYALGPCGSKGPQGYQVAVALMRRMSYAGDAAAAASQFAQTLHDRWGVGDSLCNNGVVLLVSIDDRQIFISAGSGTTSHLTYDVLGDVINDVRPALKDQRYNEAVERAVVDIGLALAGRPVAPEDGKGGRWWEEPLGLAIFGSVVFGFICFASRTESRKRRRYHDCKAKLEKLKRDQAAARANTYNPTSCPVCLEDFTVDGPAATAGCGGNGAGGGGDAQAAGSGGDDGSSAATSTPKQQLEKQGDGDIWEPLLGQGRCEGASSSPATAAGCYPGGEAPSAPELPAPQQQHPLTVEAQPPPPVTTTTQQQRRPLVLPCGHAFCEGCITQWLEQKKVTCPICRKPFDEDDSPPTSDPRDTLNLPRPPRPDVNRHDPNRTGTGNPSGDSGGAAGPSGPRLPCSVDDELYGYGSPSCGVGVGGIGTVPRLRLRWGSRRRPVRMHEDLLLAEMLFRLRQLQRQHPDYISNAMLHSWEQDLQNGREFNSQQLRQFQLNDPATRRELAYSGSSGTGARFGGGSSSGGGGRGGSW